MKTPETVNALQYFYGGEDEASGGSLGVYKVDDDGEPEDAEAEKEINALLSK